jgi:hypothetical protein
LYATSGYRLVDPELNPQTVRFFLLRGLTIPVDFLLTIGISFFSVSIAIYRWLLLVGVDSGRWFEPSIVHLEPAAGAKRRTPERSQDFFAATVQLRPWR